MKISDLIHLPDIFSLCETGAKIPWDDPEFSKRMLANHLSQEHDWASRPNTIIQQHVDYILSQVCQPGARVLDLGCGPGLYTHLLAEAGCNCVGVDFAPAAIEYAQKRASNSGLTVDYILSDVRSFRPQGMFDLVMMVFGELNEFTQEDALLLLLKAQACLQPGGRLLLEIQTPEAVEGQGAEPQEWVALDDGFLAEGPYLSLKEYAWDPDTSRAATRWVIVKEDGEVQTFASCTQSYDKWDFRKLLTNAGFSGEAKVDIKDWPTGTSFAAQLETYLCYK